MANISKSSNGFVMAVEDLDDWYFGAGWDYIADRMDGAVREDVSGDMAGTCTNQEFLEEYCTRHEAKFGEVFNIA